jgi:hypothetical protein
VAVGLAFLGILGAAIAWVARRPRVGASREIHPVRLTVGGALSELTVQNRSRRRTAGGVALEGFGRRLPIVLRRSKARRARWWCSPCPPSAGVCSGRSLLVSSPIRSGCCVGQHQRDTATLWVHPGYRPRPLPSGLHRNLDGPDSGDARGRHHVPQPP